MNLFNRKKKLTIADLAEDSQPVSPTVDFQCPPMLVAGHLCVCIGCPRASVCRIEEMARHTGCQRFIRSCSVRTIEKSGSSTCADLILEEYKEYLENKYVNGHNWG